ncbi:hypothetical protein [Sciscionella sediminilitoris]|uniref:hypothetical protein n=1 Tax=Sciscionella sediminilitoris TaxID=1445613 RepID=UPI0012E19B83|nr:hypothetical protein [Sciscionella sp. SE31]
MAGAAALSLIAGCGSAPGDNAEKSRAAPETTAMPELAATVTEKQRAANTMRFRYELDAGSDRQSGSGALDLAASGMRMEQGGQGASTTIISAKDATYVSVPPEDRADYGGKAWMKPDKGKHDLMTTLIGKLTGLLTGYVDPARSVQRMKAAGTVVRTENATVDGTPVVHHSLRLDTRKLLRFDAEEQKKLFGNDLDPGMARQIDARTRDQVAKTPASLPAELYLDRGQQLPVKAVFDSPALEGAKSPKTGKVTVRYSDWGKPVSIKTPAPNEVADAADLMGDLDAAETGRIEDDDPLLKELESAEKTLEQKHRSAEELDRMSKRLNAAVEKAQREGH